MPIQHSVLNFAKFRLQVYWRQPGPDPGVAAAGVGDEGAGAEGVGRAEPGHQYSTVQYSTHVS